jgi:deoxyhypusine synthase
MTHSSGCQQSIRSFVQKHYKHFNAAVVKEASEAWIQHLNKGGKMFLAMAGAMSSGEIGISLAEMIRQDKIHAISTTGANLEEDIFNLVAHSHYKRVPHYRELTAQDEKALRDKGLNRVTDTCIPEEEAMRKIDRLFIEIWQQAANENRRCFPYEFAYELIRSGKLEAAYEINPEHSWLLAACEKNIPVYTPGWEDSTVGNSYVSEYIKGNLPHLNIIKNGAEQMHHLVHWYSEHALKHSIGFFQIGGGIAGDFAICVVPLIIQDIKKKVPLWGYFAQISDSTTSYGSYSGAVPNEKITWYKLGENTPRFIIESDASVVAPLVFQYVLEG